MKFYNLGHKTFETDFGSNLKKNIPLSIFSGGHILRVLTDKLGGFQFYTLPPDRLFLNFACK